jgi:hypothetical protein
MYGPLLQLFIACQEYLILKNQNDLDHPEIKTPSKFCEVALFTSTLQSKKALQ